MQNYRPMRTTRTIKDLAQVQKLPWFRITNQASGPVMVSIFNEIGGPFGITAGDFVGELASLDGDIELHLNSPGGDVFDAVTIFNSLKQRKGTVAVVVDGLAASAASFIAQAASPGQLAMAPHSKMMIHDGFGAAMGNAADMRKTADLLDAISDDIASMYAERSGKPVDHWRSLMRDETWFSDKEAVSQGLADKIHGEQPQNEWDLSVYNKQDEVSAALHPSVSNADKYNADDRNRMAQSGEAMDDGSYPIADEEDLHNAIQAVGRGGADHDAIRKHIIKRAKALGMSSAIPDNWSKDGSLKSDTSNQIDPNSLRAVFLQALERGV